MGKINETVRTFNSVVRTLLFGVLLLGAGVVGWQGYSLYYQPRKLLDEKQHQLQELQAELEKAGIDLEQRDQQLLNLKERLASTEQQLEQAQTAMRLLKMRHRIAHLKVIDQSKAPDSERMVSTIEFYEVNDDRAPSTGEKKTFEVEGRVVYVECWVAMFEDQYVEEAAIDRSTAICLFQRIFGEYQNPKDGFPIDVASTSPTSYARGGQMSELEKRIWKDFWLIANDRKIASELGIRAIHGEAPSMKLENGATYELELRSTGGLTIRRLSDDWDSADS